MIEKINELKVKNRDNLRDWIEDLLKTNRTESPEIFSREKHPSIVLLDLYKNNRDLKFQRRIREIVIDLFFSYNGLDPEYFHELIILIARLRLVECYEELISKALSKEFKGKMAHGVDLHYQLLRVLYSFKNYKEQEFGKDIEMIIKKNIKNDIYFSISFRANWERTGIKNGLRVLFELLDTIESIPKHYVDFTLKIFFRKFDIDFFCEEISKAWSFFNNRQLGTLITVLSGIGVIVKKPVTEYDFLTQSLRSGDKVKIVWLVDEKLPVQKRILELPLNENDPYIRKSLESAELVNIEKTCNFSNDNPVLGTKRFLGAY